MLMPYLILEIDFVGGTHGNFLEFILNLCLTNKKLGMPFTQIGTSHKKSYVEKAQSVHSDHYMTEKIPFKGNNIIVIEIDKKVNLLNLQSIILYRAGDRKIETHDLHIKTFHKLNIKMYKSLLQNLCKSYNVNLSELEPNCPRHILREFFKHAYRDNSLFGPTDGQEEFINSLIKEGKKLYRFPVSSFYNYENFDREIKNIQQFYNFNFLNYEYKEEHREFLHYLEYFLSLNILPDKIINAVEHELDLEFDNLTILQESYINGNLERIFNKEMPFLQEKYFINTRQIIDYLKT